MARLPPKPPPSPSRPRRATTETAPTATRRPGRRMDVPFTAARSGETNSTNITLF